MRGPRPVPYTRHGITRRPFGAACVVTNEGSRAVRYRTAVVVPRSQHEVILVSPWARYRLRGRNRKPATTF